MRRRFVVAFETWNFFDEPASFVTSATRLVSCPGWYGRGT